MKLYRVFIDNGLEYEDYDCEFFLIVASDKEAAYRQRMLERMQK